MTAEKAAAGKISGLEPIGYHNVAADILHISISDEDQIEVPNEPPVSQNDEQVTISVSDAVNSDPADSIASLVSVERVQASGEIDAVSKGNSLANPILRDYTVVFPLQEIHASTPFSTSGSLQENFEHQACLCSNNARGSASCNDEHEHCVYRAKYGAARFATPYECIDRGTLESWKDMLDHPAISGHHENLMYYSEKPAKSETTATVDLSSTTFPSADNCDGEASRSPIRSLYMTCELGECSKTLRQNHDGRQPLPGAQAANTAEAVSRNSGFLHSKFYAWNTNEIYGRSCSVEIGGDSLTRDETLARTEQMAFRVNRMLEDQDCPWNIFLLEEIARLS